MTKKEFTILVDNYCADNNFTPKETSALKGRIVDVQKTHYKMGFCTKKSYEIIGEHIARV